MPRRKSQKRAEADKRIEKTLSQISNNEYESVREAARDNNVHHLTLVLRLNEGNPLRNREKTNSTSQLPKKMRL